MALNVYSFRKNPKGIKNNCDFDKSIVMQANIRTEHVHIAKSFALEWHASGYWVVVQDDLGAILWGPTDPTKPAPATTFAD